MSIRRGRWSWRYDASEHGALPDGFRPPTWLRDPSQFRFSFGAYGWTKVNVWANSGDYDSAFESAVEWLDDHAPGHLVSLSEADFLEAAEDLGLAWEPGDYESEVFEQVRDHAEADLTVIGHTTLKHGQYVLSHECFCDEVSR